jgi:ferrous iron transporter FeoB
MKFQIALVGNPNSGKTTLFNTLTGSNQFVGNWPGVTVEKKEGKYKKDKSIGITDLPGIYSLSPYTLEEVVSREYLLNEKVDVILNIVDGSNLERNLYLTTQLLELGIPVVVAVNMLDVLEKRQDKINYIELSKLLGCPVVPISALKNKGIEEVMAAVKMMAEQKNEPKNIYEDSLNQVLNQLAAFLPKSVEASQRLFYSIKLFERDNQILNYLNIDIDENIIAEYEQQMEDDSESIITDARYMYISKVISKVYDRRNREGLSISDKIDRIVTNRILALPIFALVMYIVYYVSVTSVGTMVTDWTNDVLFGEIIPPIIEQFLVSIHCAQWLIDLILDGIIAGVGAVLGFVPQLLILFVFLAILEECGYMARIAFIMDRIFRKFGLSGKSFIPMLIGTGCGVPAVMASRTIENDKDRKMTIVTTTFIPCSAKLPIIALISGALFQGASWVAPSAYFLGIVAIIVSGIILKKTKFFIGDPAPFVMEMPDYHLPQLVNVLRSVWERGFSFIKKAGTIILLSSLVLYLLQAYGFENGSLVLVKDVNHSFLANIGQAFAWIFTPLGWGNWEAAVASIGGLIAKENVVTTFGQLFGFSQVAEDGKEFWSVMASHFTSLSAYSFLAFNLLCAPCFAAIGAIKREMNSRQWTVFAISYQCGFAYIVAFMIYQLGSLIWYGVFGIETILAMIALLVMIYLLIRNPKREQTSNINYSIQ